PELPKRFLRDDVVADVAAHVLHRHAPDLLLVHFLCADSFQHLHGPRSPEAYWALEYIDHCVSRVLAALPTGALERDTAVLVVSDHGFLRSDREIRVNVRLRQLGVVKVDAEGRITESRARCVTNHGAGYVYVPDTAATTAIAPTIRTTARSSWRRAPASGAARGSGPFAAATSPRRSRTCCGRSSATWRERCSPALSPELRDGQRASRSSSRGRATSETARARRARARRTRTTRRGSRPGSCAAGAGASRGSAIRDGRPDSPSDAPGGSRCRPAACPSSRRDTGCRQG